MPKSTSAVYFLVVVMAIIVCFSILFGISAFSASGDSQLLLDAQEYAGTYAKFEHYEGEDSQPLEQMDGDSLPLEQADESVEQVDGDSLPSVGNAETFAAVEADLAEIVPFDGAELQTFGATAI
jgi:hypothetical protein